MKISSTLIGSVKRLGNIVIFSGKECIYCSSMNTRKCPYYSDKLADAFVCERCCRKCLLRDKCKSPAW